MNHLLREFFDWEREYYWMSRYFGPWCVGPRSIRDTLTEYASGVVVKISLKKVAEQLSSRWAIGWCTLNQMPVSYHLKERKLRQGCLVDFRGD